jgi:uncharacterized protein (TIGR02117 family)
MSGLNPFRRLVSMALLLVLAACGMEPASPPLVKLPPSSSGEAAYTIAVTSNGWHSGIVLARADLPPHRIPEADDLSGARFLEFGWGDAEFYPAKETTLAMALRAGLMPTPAVVHMAGLSVPPARRYPGAEVISLTVDAGGMTRLIDFIDASFNRQGRARATSSGPGLYADSRFYPAHGRFHLFNTCNTWTARALAAAGFDIQEAGAAIPDAGLEAGRRRCPGGPRRLRRRALCAPGRGIQPGGARFRAIGYGYRGRHHLLQHTGRPAAGHPGPGRGGMRQIRQDGGIHRPGSAHLPVGHPGGGQLPMRPALKAAGLAATLHGSRNP